MLPAWRRTQGQRATKPTATSLPQSDLPARTDAALGLGAFHSALPRRHAASPKARVQARGGERIKPVPLLPAPATLGTHCGNLRKQTWLTVCFTRYRCASYYAFGRLQRGGASDSYA